VPAGDPLGIAPQRVEQDPLAQIEGDGIDRQLAPQQIALEASPRRVDEVDEVVAGCTQAPGRHAALAEPVAARLPSRTERSHQSGATVSRDQIDVRGDPTERRVPDVASDEIELRADALRRIPKP
jgi:hypothetical protein